MRDRLLHEPNTWAEYNCADGGICPECGAVVRDVRPHIEFHDRLNQSTERAR